MEAKGAPGRKDHKVNAGKLEITVFIQENSYYYTHFD
jgi:hypothetical protein